MNLKTIGLCIAASCISTAGGFAAGFFTARNKYQKDIDALLEILDHTEQESLNEHKQIQELRRKLGSAIAEKAISDLPETLRPDITKDEALTEGLEDIGAQAALEDDFFREPAPIFDDNKPASIFDVVIDDKNTEDVVKEKDVEEVVETKDPDEAKEAELDAQVFEERLAQYQRLSPAPVAIPNALVSYFRDQGFDYDTYTWNSMSDLVVDTLGTTISDAEEVNLFGPDWRKYFDEGSINDYGDSDTVFIRNDTLLFIFEITREFENPSNQN